MASLSTTPSTQTTSARDPEGPVAFTVLITSVRTSLLPSSSEPTTDGPHEDDDDDEEEEEVEVEVVEIKDGLLVVSVREKEERRGNRLRTFASGPTRIIRFAR